MSRKHSSPAYFFMRQVSIDHLELVNTSKKHFTKNNNIKITFLLKNITPIYNNRNLHNCLNKIALYHLYLPITRFSSLA